MSWRSKAACTDENTELFFAVGSAAPALEQVERAKAVCRRCEVVAQRLHWALETRQQDGVWGGLTEDERRALRQRRERPHIRTQLRGVDRPHRSTGGAS
ncbi:MAG: WhiB family transcriptional regulator [Egibacteraceae bacterium]